MWLVGQLSRLASGYAHAAQNPPTGLFAERFSSTLESSPITARTKLGGLFNSGIEPFKEFKRRHKTGASLGVRYLFAMNSPVSDSLCRFEMIVHITRNRYTKNRLEKFL